MTFDKPEHQTLVLELIKGAQFPGTLLDIVLELRTAARMAEITVHVVEAEETL